MKKEWIVVANGTKVKILKKDGQALDHVFPTLHKDEIVEKFDQDAKKPGHIRQAQGFLGKFLSPHEDLHKHEKKEFLSEIAKRINSHTQEFDQLILIVPSEDVSVFHSSLSHMAKGKITREIHKDLTKIPLKEVWEYVTALPGQ